MLEMVINSAIDSDSIIVVRITWNLLYSEPVQLIHLKPIQALLLLLLLVMTQVGEIITQAYHHISQMRATLVFHL